MKILRKALGYDFKGHRERCLLKEDQLAPFEDLCGPKPQ